jgi:BlaI family penicillinase repressor
MKKDQDVSSILLTRRELQIMKVIWDEGEATVKQVCDAISQHRATAYTTILTFMGILEEKGALTHTKSGRAYIYRPVLTREQATQNHVRDVIMRFFDGNPEKLIADVVDNDTKPLEQVAGANNLVETWQTNEVA